VSHALALETLDRFPLFFLLRSELLLVGTYALAATFSRLVAILATLTTVTFELPFRVEGLFTLVLVSRFDVISDI
jgi:hypothetical protein